MNLCSNCKYCDKKNKLSSLSWVCKNKQFAYTCFDNINGEYLSYINCNEARFSNPDCPYYEETFWHMIKLAILKVWHQTFN